MVSCMWSSWLSICGRKLPELPSALPLYRLTTPPDYTLTAYWPTAGLSAFDWTGPLGDPANHWAARHRGTPVIDYLAETGENMMTFELKLTIFSPDFASWEIEIALDYEVKCSLKQVNRLAYFAFKQKWKAVLSCKKCFKNWLFKMICL